MTRTRVSLCFVLAVCALTAAPAARVRDDDMAARLTRLIDPLIAYYQPNGVKAPANAVVDAMIENKARNQAFRLEAVLRLYEKAIPDLEKYRRKVKELEDGLGAYAFSVDSLKYAQDSFEKENKARAPDAARTAAQAQVLAELKKEQDTARGVFTKFIERSTLPSDLPKLRTIVQQRFPKRSPDKERAYVIGELRGVLSEVKDGRYDFNKLEEGIHEFRRKLRWFPVLIDGLDGFVMLRTDPPGACPVPAFEKLADSDAAKHRYATPALRNPGPCQISRCLLWEAVQTVNGLGDLKDEAQGNTAIAEALENDLFVASKKVVTPEEIARAKAIRTEFLSSKTPDLLMAQLSSCKP